MDSAKHSAATGGQAKIGANAGTAFSAWDGGIKGRTLHGVPKKLVVQTWRGADWDKALPDSILVLTFSDGQVEMTHANVPDLAAAGIKDGWNQYYWKPWRAWLKAQR